MVMERVQNEIVLSVSINKIDFWRIHPWDGTEIMAVVKGIHRQSLTVLIFQSVSINIIDFASWTKFIFWSVLGVHMLCSCCFYKARWQRKICFSNKYWSRRSYQEGNIQISIAVAIHLNHSVEWLQLGDVTKHMRSGLGRHMHLEDSAPYHGIVADVEFM